jgi:hypothetical protein
MANPISKATPKMTLEAQIQALLAENATLRAAKQASAPTKAIKVSQSGGVSVYGLGRFPVTLYKEQWLSLLDMGEDIKAFITANNVSLSQGKSDPRFATQREQAAVNASRR